jgi:hypothetical protein
LIFSPTAGLVRREEAMRHLALPTLTAAEQKAILRVTAVYRATHDLFLAQRFAKHVSPLITVVYTKPARGRCARSAPRPSSRTKTAGSFCGR